MTLYVLRLYPGMTAGTAYTHTQRYPQLGMLYLSIGTHTHSTADIHIQRYTHTGAS